MGAIFDPEVLKDVVKAALPLPLAARLDRIRGDLADRYPGHVQPSLSWIFNVAGGAVGQMAVLHASVTEYVILFGTSIGTEGYSGRFPADDYFIILEGEQWAFGPGELDRSVYRPGDMHRMPRGVARAYRMPDRCYALEYARGAIPLMLPFGLADAFSSTLDPVPVLQTMRAYGKAVVGELLRGKI